MNKNKPPRRGDIYWVQLDPTIGSEVNKTRPAVVVSNDAANTVSSRVIVAPMTSRATRVFPFEVKVTVKGKVGKVLLDQVRSVDKQRLSKQLATLDVSSMEQIDKALKIALALS